MDPAMQQFLQALMYLPQNKHWEMSNNVINMQAQINQNPLVK
jgi:hypothetical protein